MRLTNGDESQTLKLGVQRPLDESVRLMIDLKRGNGIQQRCSTLGPARLLTEAVLSSKR